MFRVIKVIGTVLIKENGMIVGTEYLETQNVTLLYCFCTSAPKVNQYFESITKAHHALLLPQVYHDAYLKNYYYDEQEVISFNKSDIKLFQNIKFISQNFFIFFEMKIRKQRIKEKMMFNDVDELKDKLIHTYSVKFLVPFFYSIREMKELIPEKRIKVKDINLLYLLENKTLEGKKR